MMAYINDWSSQGVPWADQQAGREDRYVQSLPCAVSCSSRRAECEHQAENKLRKMCICHSRAAESMALALGRCARWCVPHLATLKDTDCADYLLWYTDVREACKRAHCLSLPNAVHNACLIRCTLQLQHRAANTSQQAVQLPKRCCPRFWLARRNTRARCTSGELPYGYVTGSAGNKCTLCDFKHIRCAARPCATHTVNAITKERSFVHSMKSLWFCVL